MSLCVDCLIREKPGWLKQYRKGTLALMIYASVFLLPESPLALILQSLFFLVLFPWILWPLFAAAQFRFPR